MSRIRISWLGKSWLQLVWPAIILVLGVTAWLTYGQWRPLAERTLAYLQNRDVEPTQEPAREPVASFGEDSIKLSPTAWKNIGLKTAQVTAADYVRVVSVPAMVVERPGRSQIEIAAPMTGIVTQVYPLERESVEPGQPLFELRLTHEDVVSAQADFLDRLHEMDVVQRELKRLNEVGEGVIPGKRIIEQEYKRDQSKSALATIRQSLLLHGMSKDQVTAIERDRKVIQNVIVVAPPYAENHEHVEIAHQYHVQTISVNRGQNVEAGQLLAVLADHCLLYLEGNAFEDDANRLVGVSQAGERIEVMTSTTGGTEGPRLALQLQSVSDQIDPQSRALKFYLLLPNEQLHPPNPSTDSLAGQFVMWKYRPGQRMEVQIPTTQVMKNKLVLPANAVVVEGPNAFVFEQNGDNFDRIDVQVLFRDKDSVVLENDGQLIGSTIAIQGAYDMHLAIRNQSGGAFDPHAGHTH